MLIKRHKKQMNNDKRIRSHVCKNFITDILCDGKISHYSPCLKVIVIEFSVSTQNCIRFSFSDEELILSLYTFQKIKIIM